MNHLLAPKHGAKNFKGVGENLKVDLKDHRNASERKVKGSLENIGEGSKQMLGPKKAATDRDETSHKVRSKHLLLSAQSMLSRID